MVEAPFLGSNSVRISEIQGSAEVARTCSGAVPCCGLGAFVGYVALNDHSLALIKILGASQYTLINYSSV